MRSPRTSESRRSSLDLNTSVPRSSSSSHTFNQYATSPVSVVESSTTFTRHITTPTSEVKNSATLSEHTSTTTTEADQSSSPKRTDDNVITDLDEGLSPKLLQAVLELDQSIDQALTHVAGLKDALASFDRVGTMTSSLADVVIYEANRDVKSHPDALLAQQCHLFGDKIIRLVHIIGTSDRDRRRLDVARSNLEAAYEHLSLSFVSESFGMDLLGSKVSYKSLEKRIDYAEHTLERWGGCIKECCEQHRKHVVPSRRMEEGMGAIEQGGASGEQQI